MHHAPLRLLLKNLNSTEQHLCQHFCHALHIVTERGFYLKKLIKIKMHIKIFQKSILHSDKNYFYLLFSVLHQK